LNKVFPTRTSLVKFVLLAAFGGGLAAGAAVAALPEPGSTTEATSVPDDREASFMPSPLIADQGAALPDQAQPKDDKAKIAAPQKLTPNAGAPPAIVIVPQPVDAKPAVAVTGAPVEAETIAPVDPDAVGLLAPNEGGLGSLMWKDTSRALVEKLLPELGLPAATPTLNGLARRLLLTVAQPPVGAAEKNLTALRLEKLVALGQGPAAWQLMKRATPDRIDAITQRLVITSALTGAESASVCADVPQLIEAHKTDTEAGVEWQKTLIVCQLLAKDNAAAQVGLDVLREQKAKDDLFLSIANRNIIAQSKLLPSQLTPLRPLTLALLRQTQLPLPASLYGRPDASLIPDLLLAKSTDESARLALAEKAAAKGILAANALRAVYQSVSFPPDQIAGPDGANQTGALLRALLLQSLDAVDNAQRATRIERFVRSIDKGALAGALGQVAADLVASLPVAAGSALPSSSAVRVMTLAGRPEQALAWLKVARAEAASKPDIAEQLQEDWPLLVLSGLVSDADFKDELAKWLDRALAASEAESPRAQRQKAGETLLLLGASGFALPEEAALRVIDVPGDIRKIPAAPAFLLERLRQAGTANRRGEAVLLTLLLLGGDVSSASLGTTLEAVRALRLTGLPGDAQALAREALLSL
jgi:hypothetical protein